jgi:hypothetical protein
MNANAQKRILVVANQTVEDEAVYETVRARANGGAEVFVVAPALNSRLRHWLSDVDEARHAAEDRLAKFLGRLLRSGLPARGCVGDSDPLQAMADALRQFPADEIVISTHPRERSNWLARNLVERARRRHTQEIMHVVVDREPYAAAA